MHVIKINYSYNKMEYLCKQKLTIVYYITMYMILDVVP